MKEKHFYKPLSCHYIYTFPPEMEDSSAFIRALMDAADYQIAQMIPQGKASGELCCIYNNVEYRGKWQVEVKKAPYTNPL